MAIKHPYQGHFMEDAFLGFVRFSANEVEAVKAFQEDNPDIKVSTSLSPMDKMIDQATGRDEVIAQRFVDWCLDRFGRPEDLEKTGDDDI